MIRIPAPHYGLAFERTDGGPPWVALKGCEGCKDEAAHYNAVELAGRLIEHDGIDKVQVVKVTYSAREIIS
jgi:hypothetical protein